MVIEVVEKRDFGVRDKKHRTVGGVALVWGRPDGKWEGYAHTTRNGQQFGAIPARSIRLFDSEIEARAYAVQCLDRQAKRYQKQYGTLAGSSDTRNP